jgi:predicted RNA binding protein YcfA (HicA-like mRNA interferase family)
LKLPRDLSGDELVRALRRLGYEVTRQTGSHVRLASRSGGKEHHITIPLHKQLRVGTLAQILGDVATFKNLTREKLLEELFGK